MAYKLNIPSTTKYLILHESPSEVRTIRTYIPKDYIWMATIWHFMKTSPKELDIDCNTWKLNWKPDISKKENVKNIWEAIKIIRKNWWKVILAWDHDREGQVINFSVVDHFKLKSNEYVVHRNPWSLAKDSYLKNLLNPLPTLDMGPVEAGITRQLLDKYVWFEMSSHLWNMSSKYKPYLDKIKEDIEKKVKKFEENNKEVLENNKNIRKIIEEYKNIDFKKLETFEERKWISFWRVQTISLILLVQKELEKFEKELDRKVNIQAEDKDKLLWEYSKNWELETNIWKMRKIYSLLESWFKNKTIKKIIIKDIQSSIKKVSPPTTLDTIMAQKSLSWEFWFSSKRIMEILQKTYEWGLTTYMRTDTNATWPEEDKYIKEMLDSLWEEYFYRKYTVKWAQEGHIWILPTEKYNIESLKDVKKKDWTKLTEDEYKVFEYIIRRTVSAFMWEAKIEYFNYILEVELENWIKEQFILKDTNIIEEWFLKVFIYAKRKYKQKVFYKKWEEIEILKFIWKEKDIKLPGGYTETSFTEELIKNWIGRPSTYVSNIENLIDKKVIQKKWNKLIVTPKGFWVYQVVTQNDKDFWRFKNITFTAKMEEGLDLIAKKKIDRKPVLNWVKEEIDKLKELAPKREVSKSNWKSLWSCPSCKKWEIIENAKAWGCSNWKWGCKFTIWRRVMWNYDLTEEERDSMIKNLESPTLNLTSKWGKEYKAKLIFKKKKGFEAEFVN